VRVNQSSDDLNKSLKVYEGFVQSVENSEGQTEVSTNFFFYPFYNFV
jgi:hypothetical protein